MPPKQTDKIGALYLAFGRPYLAMALLSAYTLRKTNPGIPICIITNITSKHPNAPFWDSSRDSIIFIEKDSKYNRKIKVSLNNYTPFHKTIFLDCDTIVRGNLSSTTFFLDHFDIALRLNPGAQQKKGKAGVILFNNTTVSNLPHWNSGVIFFRKGEETNDFFYNWESSFKELNNKFDQVSLAKAIFLTKAKVLSFDDRWNFHPRSLFVMKADISKKFIIHYTSQINGVLFRQILRFSKFIPCKQESDEEIINFVYAKRRERRRKIGALKYLILKAEWSIARQNYIKGLT